MADSMTTGARDEVWPSLPLDEWRDTYATLHMWTQIVGKIRLVQSPRVNHWWQVPLYVSARGLTTTAIPHGTRNFEIEFDFIEHQLVIRTSDGETRTLRLAPRAVADFYRELMATLGALGLEVKIRAIPDEVPNPIPFAEDYEHASYDAEYVNRLWRILTQSDRVLKEFRSRFTGKVSPVHFFWGSFDLAVTRFSGRRAPDRAGADSINREAYSHEVISHGFWPGSGNIQMPAFYSYTTPEPAGLPEAAIRPAGAFYNPPTGGFILPYDDVRQAAAPALVWMEFLQSTYEAGANLAKWDRAALERAPTSAAPSAR
ncbi:MAG TPA: DUF5996 family protein [Pyrinomonadaceae bacterium]|nr:DUF5996 family protein [Pyrinomonadaceae bacterium]